MESFIETMHGVAAILLLLIYLLLAARMFRAKVERFSSLDRAPAQIARLVLLLVYLSGLIMSYSLGRIVHPAHYVIGLLPIVVLLGVHYAPQSFPAQREKAYARLFAALFMLTLLAWIIHEICRKLILGNNFKAVTTTR